MQVPIQFVVIAIEGLDDLGDSVEPAFEHIVMVNPRHDKALREGIWDGAPTREHDGAVVF
jgi:hypothetical protein